MSPVLPSLLNSSPIVVALELHHAHASTTHPPPFPITPNSLTCDPTAAGARHLIVDRPSRASNDQISPTTVIPYLRSYLATIPSSQNRTTGEEPPSGSPTTGSHRRGPPPDAVTPLSLARGPAPTAPARAVPLLRGSAGPPARARSPTLAGPKSPPAQLAGNSFSFSFFPFLFPIFIYIHILIFYTSFGAGGVAPVGGDVALAAVDEFVGNGTVAGLFKGLDDFDPITCNRPLRPVS